MSFDGNYVILNSENVCDKSIPSNARIEVSFIEAELSLLEDIKKSENITSDLVSINGWHTGILFYVVETREAFTWQFEGIDFTGALMPTIANGDLTWDNEAVIALGNMDSSYWEKSTYMCTINKSTFLKLQKDMITTYTPQNPAYVLFMVAQTSAEYLNPLAANSICDDMCYYVLNQLQNVYDVAINYAVPPHISVFILEANSVEVVDMTDSTQKAEVVSFYTKLENVLTDGKTDISKLWNAIKDSDVANLVIDLVSVANLWKQLLQSVDSTYTYTYAYDKNHKLQYFKFVMTGDYANYQIYTALKNNVQKKNFVGKPITVDSNVDFNDLRDPISSCHENVSIVHILGYVLIFMGIVFAWIVVLFTRKGNLELSATALVLLPIFSVVGLIMLRIKEPLNDDTCGNVSSDPILNPTPSG